MRIGENCMEIRKQRTCVAVVAFFCIIVGFTACAKSIDNPPCPTTNYFATWEVENMPLTLTITAKNIKAERLDSDFYWTSVPSNWTQIANKDSDTKDNYPSGYRYNGTFTDHSGGVNIIGNENTWSFFINTNKENLLWVRDNGNLVLFKVREKEILWSYK